MSGGLHLIKMAPGLRRPEELDEWAQRTFGNGTVWITTKSGPKRAAELLDGGSMYWVFATQILARQRIMEIRPPASSHERCSIALDREVIRVNPAPKRAFQGWRYLEAAHAPGDLPAGREGDDELPEEIRRVLSNIGLF